MLVSQKSTLPEQGCADARTFVQIFCAERPRLWQLIRFRLDPRLSRRIEVEDVLQDVYLQASRRYQAYLESDYPSAYLWLRDVAIQTLSNVHRFHFSTQRRNLRLESHEHPEGSAMDPVQRLAAALTTPSQAVVRRELMQEVRKALAMLSPGDREIVEMRQFEELSNEEVAHLLRITPKAASIRYVRALGRLRKLIEEVAPEFAIR